MPWRLGAFVVGGANGREKGADRNQQEAHGEQASAGDTAPLVAVAVSPAPTAAIEGIDVARPPAVGTAELDFRCFQNGRHTDKIPPSEERNIAIGIRAAFMLFPGASCY